MAQTGGTAWQPNSQQKSGELIQADFTDNTGGLNYSSSHFNVKDTESTGGTNSDYNLIGGFEKRRGYEKINATPDTELRTLGLEQSISSNGSRLFVRTAGARLQVVDIDAPLFTNLSEDTATATTAFFTDTQQVASYAQFNTGAYSALWAVGAGATRPVGVYSSTKATTNGVAAPAGSLTLTVQAGTGAWLTSGTYRYSVLFRKASTQAVGNVSLDVSVAVANLTQEVLLTFSGISNIDTTKYDSIYLYRSSVNGSDQFTTGDLVTTLSIAVTSYTDRNATLASSQNIPRAGNTILDNSQLAVGTFNAITSFKRRLVVASGNAIYLSDVNKPESYPTENVFYLPSGGPITALTTSAFTSVEANTLDEFLIIFQNGKVWALVGSSISDWSLKEVDNVGAVNQTCVIKANGYLFWMSTRGVFMWSGAGKPIYCSASIETLFEPNGDIDKSKLNYCTGMFAREKNQVIWYLSHKIYGEQKFALKLDLNLTMPQLDASLVGNKIPGVFLADSSSTVAVYASRSSTLENNNELLLIGDSSGYLGKAYKSQADFGADYSWTYATRFLDMGSVGQDKRFHKVIAWVVNIGNWPIYLDYWSGYKSGNTIKTTIAGDISTENTSVASLWDSGSWDVALWDDFDTNTLNLTPVVFNLNPGLQRASEGDCIRLQFRNETMNQPVSVVAFSVVYSMKGLTK